MVYQFQLGQMRCTVCSDGQMKPPWEPPWEEFFGADTGVSDAELSTALAEEGASRSGLALGYNCLCIETSDQTILIDTGLGRNFHGYGPELSEQVGKLGDALQRAQLRPSDISTVVLTHLHQDHLRGAIWSGALTFPTAQYVVHSAELAYWRDGLERPENADHAAVAATALMLLDRHVRRVGYDDEVVPGIRTIAASGHTPGHMGVLVQSDDQRVLCVGDLFYDPIQVRHPHWWTRYDLDPERSVQARRDLVGWAAREGLLVQAYHLPFPGLGRIRHDGTAFAWESVLS